MDCYSLDANVTLMTLIPPLVPKMGPFSKGRFRRPLSPDYRVELLPIQIILLKMASLRRKLDLKVIKSVLRIDVKEQK
jgi:hypothetical protein